MNNTLEEPPSTQTQANADKRAFFRQSGWMMFASLAGGVFMFAVHFFSDKIGDAEYGIFGTLLSMLYFIGIPAVSFQMVFTRQTAFAMTESQQRGLKRTVRTVGLWVLVLWVALAGGTLLCQHVILKAFQISMAALWVTIGIAAVTMFKPIFFGVVQGKQDFFWLGWASILSGVGRFTLVAIFVLLFKGGAAAVMFGALCGELVGLLVGIGRSREMWTGPSEAIDWRHWLAKMAPLTLGFAAFQFIYTADPMFARLFLDKTQTGGYVAANTLSRALVLFTGQLALVMFPKLVRSAASAQKTDMFKITLLSTAVLAALGALFISYLLPIGLRLFFKQSFVTGIPLLPPFAASMAVLTVANVLINNLLAHEKFQVVPWLVTVAVAYALTVILKFHQTAGQIIYTLGAFSLLLAGMALFFTWRSERVG